MNEPRLNPTLRQVFTHDLRVRALVALEQEASSASRLAAAFGVEVNKMAYHVRALEKAGLIELVETRIAGPSVERIYRARRSGWADAVVALNELGG